MLGCAIIFCLANVVKAVLAKRLASHFHREAHFQKMRDAIKKVPYQQLAVCPTPAMCTSMTRWSNQWLQPGCDKPQLAHQLQHGQQLRKLVDSMFFLGCPAITPIDMKDVSCSRWYQTSSYTATGWHALVDGVLACCQRPPLQSDPMEVSAAAQAGVSICEP